MSGPVNMTDRQASDESPPVTVVIPAYNASATIEATLRSALRQSYPNVNYVVVDDASTDDTAAKVRAMACERPLRLIAAPANGGAPKARNLGAAISEDVYIAFLDSDDTWAEDKLEKQVARFREHPEAVLCYSCITHRDENEQEIFTSTYTRSGDLKDDLLERNVVGSTSGALIRRSAFEAVGGFDLDFTACQDWDLWVRLTDQGPFVCAPEPLTSLLHHQGLRITNNGRRRLKGYLQFYRRHLRPRRRTGDCDLRSFYAAFGDVLLQSGRPSAAARFYFGAWRMRPLSPRNLVLAIGSRLGLSYAGAMNLNRRFSRLREAVRG